MLVEFATGVFKVAPFASDAFDVVVLLTDVFETAVLATVELVEFWEVTEAPPVVGATLGPLKEKTADFCTINGTSALKIPRKAYKMDMTAMTPIEKMRKCMNTLMSLGT